LNKNFFYCTTEYYRISYENENWHKIVQLLNSTEYENISANRTKIIDDVFHFTARRFNISIFWKLTNYLLTKYSARYPMIKILEYMSNMIPFYNPFAVTIMVKDYG